MSRDDLNGSKARKQRATPAPIVAPKPGPVVAGQPQFLLKYPLGVDYSNWEPGMVLSDIQPPPIFVYCRASLGVAYVDPSMRYYEKQAETLGVDFSPYHFPAFNLIRGNDLQAQVDNFTRATFGFKFNDQQPPMLDAEYDPGPWSKLGLGLRGQALANAYKFILDGMEKATGVIPWIYTNANYWGKTAYDPTGKKDPKNFQAPEWSKCYPCIVAWYPNNPDEFNDPVKSVLPSGFVDFRGWQYASNGRSAGWVKVANDLSKMYLGGMNAAKPA